MADLDVITAGIPLSRDGCPVLTRVNAYLVPEMMPATLQHVLRDRQGNPLDLSAVSQVSESASAVQIPDAVLVRVREATALGAREATTIHAFEGDIVDAANGVVSMRLSTAVSKQSGLYTANWAFVRNGDIQAVNNALISVEPNLWGGSANSSGRLVGCPTIQEIRMQMWDSAPAENTLLNDVEYSDEQILQAVLKPIQYFNETNPPIGRYYGTMNFPWRSHWIDATIGYLMQFAAQFYHRNRLQGSAGGVNIDELGRGDLYTRLSQQMIGEYKDWVLRCKTTANAAQAVGSLGSSYADI